jgi:hypothetical protein
MSPGLDRSALGHDGRWLMQVSWLERRTCAACRCGRRRLVLATVMRSALTSVTTPSFSATTTSAASTAARYSMPVPM